MKTLLLLLIPLVMQGQIENKKMVLIEGFGVESNYPEVANVILEEFYNDAAKENFYPREYVEQNLKGIYFVSAQTIERYTNKNDNRAGSLASRYNDLTGKTEMLILIDIVHINALENLKIFTYHELGHFFGLSHEENITPDIMNAQINRTYLTNETLRYFFQKLKNSAPNKYRSKL